MPRGPGKYGDLCHKIHVENKARRTILIIEDGINGDAFDVEADIEDIQNLPSMLRDLADALEEDLKKGIV